jgi:hypothetical protein
MTRCSSMGPFQPCTGAGCADRICSDVLPKRRSRVEGGNRLVQRRLVEIGPQPVAEKQLGVCGLPQQEVADPHFAAGADHQIRIGHMGQGHGAVQAGLGNGLAARRQRCSRLGNVPAAAIVEAHVENEARVSAVAASACAKPSRTLGDRPARSPTKQTHTVLFELRHLAGQRHGQQLHEARDLIDRTIPVFR